MKGILTGGKVPYSVVVMLSFAMYLMGHQSARPAPRVAVAEKGAVILEAALDHPSASQETMRQIVAQPVRAVMQRYQQAGYVVIDTSRDDQGDMTVDALPADTVDITNELRTAVHLPVQKSTPPAVISASAVAPASASGAP